MKSDASFFYQIKRFQLSLKFFSVAQHEFVMFAERSRADLSLCFD